MPGVTAYTTLPIIGVPIVSGELDGMDALLSIVQMPPGIPVASVAINGALNAGILACEILSLKYDNLKKVLLEYKNEMKKKVEEKNNALQQKIADL